ncbi:MAG: HupE/UreJ family protein [Patescibacteria group bacterium]
MKYVLAVTILMFLFTVTIPVKAHELLPQEVINFLKENPDATSEEINEFAETQSPEVAEKIRVTSADDITLLTQNNDAGFFHNAKDFVSLGIEHILAGPDHILFVLSLLLMFVSVGEIFRLVTTFTIAHSLTLILAGTGTLVLSSAIVEPVIALSIAVVAIVTTFFGHVRVMAHQWAKTALVFFFGLFHGLGFAGLLTEISVPKETLLSSLLAFNIGIELGQLLIIVIALPVLLYCKQKTWYPRAVKIVAIIISVIAIVWFFERLVALF